MERGSQEGGPSGSGFWLLQKCVAGEGKRLRFLEGEGLAALTSDLPRVLSHGSTQLCTQIAVRFLLDVKGNERLLTQASFHIPQKQRRLFRAAFGVVIQSGLTQTLRNNAGLLDILKDKTAEPKLLHSQR